MKRLLFLMSMVLWSSASLDAQWTQLSGPYGFSGSSFAELRSGNALVVAGTYNGIYRTTDSGATWVQSGLAQASIESLWCVSHDDRDEFLALADYNLPNMSAATYYRSLDSGQTWEIVDNSNFGDFGTLAVGDTLFQTMSSNEIDSSLDGGATWSPFRIFSQPYFENVLTIGKYLIVFLTDSSMLRWSNAYGWQQTSFSSQWLYPTFKQCGSILVAGTDTGIVVSLDSGLDWSKPANSGLGIYTNVFEIAGNDSVLVCDAGGTMFRSTDTGTHWTSIGGRNGFPLYYSSGVLECINGQFLAGISPGVYISPDGLHWSRKTKGILEATVWSLATLDSVVYAAAGNGVYRGSAFGSVWPDLQGNQNLEDSGVSYLTVVNDSLYPSGNGFWLKNGAGQLYNPSGTDVEQVTYDNGDWFGSLGWNGIGMSSDGGYTWQNIGGGEIDTGNYVGLVISAYGNLIAFTSPDFIYRSTDSGVNWTMENNSPGISPTAYAVSRFGIYVADGFGVYRSTDSGYTWELDTTTEGDYSSVLANYNGGIVMGIMDDGFLSGRTAGLYFTSDGTTWIPISQRILDIWSFASDSEYAYLGTLGNGIWRIERSSLPPAEVRAKPVSPETFNIYPNPSSGFGTISFTIPSAGIVTLEVCDELGIHRATIFSGILASGHHEIPLSQAMLPNGMYEIVLSTPGNRSVCPLVFAR